MLVYTVALSHITCPGLHVHAFSDIAKARKYAADHVRAMYAERRKSDGRRAVKEWGLKPGRITVNNWEEYANALDDYEGEGYVCVQWFQAELDAKKAAA